MKQNLLINIYTNDCSNRKNGAILQQNYKENT